MKCISTAIRPPCSLGLLRAGRFFPLLIVCGLLLESVHAHAVTVKVESTSPWIGWMNIFDTNGAFVGGNSWAVADLPAIFIPANNPSGWPLNTLLILRPNTSSYNTNDAYWNFPNGSPNKVLEPHFYVDVFTEFAGQTVTFNGSVTSNSIPGLTGGPATGWQAVAFIKEFTSSYDYLGATTVPLIANSPFSLSRPIGTGNVCQYGFYVRGPNTAPGSVNALSGVGILVEDPIPCELTEFAIRSSIREADGRFTLSWESCPDQLYEVQTSENLYALAGWTRRDLMIGNDGATTWTNTNPPAVTHQFYRVQRFRFAGDEDVDGLANLDEFTRGTDLRNPDSDGDGMPDGWEIQYGFDPLAPEDAHADFDGDGYSNLQEQQLQTKPNASHSQPAYLPRSLVGWWKLDEGTGTNVFDSSLNRHDGYVLGVNPTSVWTTGYFSNAAMVGGPANNRIQVPYHASLNTTQALTLMGWVKPSGQGNLIGNWDFAGQVPGNYRIQFGPDSVELRFSPDGDGSYSTIQFNPNWSTNEWHHLTVCYSDGTNVTVFVDGEWRAGGIVTGPFVPVANPILIGFPGSADACSVDDVRIYNRALATNEIASLSRGNGLPVSMIVGQTATLRAFGAAEGDTCQWSLVSGQGFFTNVAAITAEFRPSWSGAVTVQAVWESGGVFHTNLSSSVASFPNLSPLSDWNDGGLVQFNNNCYNFATDIRTDTIAQPGGPPFYNLYTCEQQTSGAISDGLESGVALNDLCFTSGLPDGHIAALLILPPLLDFHWVRMEADGTWSSKAGGFPATRLDNAGQPITDPRTANWETIFGSYQFCGFFWVGPDVNILHYPQ